MKFIDETAASKTDYEMDLEEERRDLYRQSCMTDLMGFQQTLIKMGNCLKNEQDRVKALNSMLKNSQETEQALTKTV